MFELRILAICLVLGWAGQKSINGDPAASLIAAHRPVWYNGLISSSLVYQKSGHSVNSHGESRAFPSPVYYAPAVSSSAERLPISTTISTITTEAAPKKYDIFKFFEKLKRVNEKYAARNKTVGAQKQLNEDTEEEHSILSTPISEGDDDDDMPDRQDRAESDNNETVEEAINEGMLIVTKMCDIKSRVMMDLFSPRDFL